MGRTASSYAQIVASEGAKAMQQGGGTYFIPTPPGFQNSRQVQPNPVARVRGSGSRLKPAHAVVPQSQWQGYQVAEARRANNPRRMQEMLSTWRAEAGNNTSLLEGLPPHLQNTAQSRYINMKSFKRQNSGEDWQQFVDEMGAIGAIRNMSRLRHSKCTQEKERICREKGKICNPLTGYCKNEVNYKREQRRAAERQEEQQAAASAISLQLGRGMAPCPPGQRGGGTKRCIYDVLGIPRR